MISPESPPDEVDRVAALCALEVLDSSPEPRFDRITRVVARLLRVPIALVSLVDTDRQWFKSRVGLDATETPRSISFCGHAILGSRTFVVPNACLDPRFADNPLVVGPPHIRAYAGHPVRTESGHRVGTLCVIDVVPRSWTEEEQTTLAELAQWVETELGVLTAARARELINRYERFFALSSDLFVIVGLDGTVHRLSPSWSTALGRSLDELRAGFLELLHPDDLEPARREAARFAAGEGSRPFECRIRHADGSWRTLAWSPVPRADEGLVYVVARDVTEERRTHAALVESERRYRDLFDNANDLIQSVDAAGRFLYVNRAWRETLGYGDDELAHVNLFDVIAPSSRTHCAELFAEVARGATLDRVEVEFLTREGATVALEGSVSALREDDRLLSTRAIFRDVTKKRRTERALARSHEMVQAISAAQSGFISAQDSRQVFEHLLTEMLRMTESEYGFIGEVHRDADGTPYLEMHAVANLAWDDEARARYEQSAAARPVFRDLETLYGAVMTSRAPVLTNDLADDPRRAELPYGPPSPSAFLGLPIFRGEDMTGIVGIASRASGYDARVIEYLAPFLATCATLVEAVRSERRRRASEQAVVESEAHLRAIVESAVDALVTIDQEGRIEMFNAAAEHLFGWPAATVLGRSVSCLMPTPHREQHDGYLDEYQRTGIRKIIGAGREVVAVRSDGSTFVADLAVSEIQLAGRRIFTGRIHDLTERKRVEQLKSEFVATVSHELRTPLTSIRGSLGLLAGGIVGELPASARSMIDIALNNAERLVRLINDILDIEKIESGQMRFAPRATDLGALVAQAVDAHLGFAEPLGIRIVHVDEAGPALLDLDPDRMSQVLANLISNAAKFAPRGSDIVVRLLRAGGRLRIEVEDRGPGIPEAFHSRIFERFAQADASDKRSRGGSGLGLSITKAIVERSGGQIGFETAVGQGTTFWVTFPDAPAPVRGPSPEGEVAARVLVCEDDADIAALLTTMLREAGFACDVASTGREARALLDREIYELITLDLLLPDVDGFQLLSELRERHPDTPVVVVSGRARSDELELGSVGVVDWIRKPFDPERLLATMRAAIEAAPRPPRVLHVEDDPGNSAIVRGILRGVASVVDATSLAEAKRTLAETEIDLALLDLTLPDGDGLALLPLLGEKGVPVIVFSAAEVSADMARRVEATLIKSRVTNEALRQTIVRVLGRRR